MDEPAEPPRQVAHFALLILVGLMIVGSLALSRRPPTLASMPLVVHVADIPPHDALLQLGAYTELYGALVPHTDWRPQVAALLGRTGDATDAPPRLGYWVRQWTFLGLPIFARKESGYSVYFDRPDYIRAAPLSEEGLAQLEKQTGSRFWAGWWFPFWRFSWGLLAVAAVGGWVWLEFRWQAKRRTLMGLI